eukprot:g21250.t1
MAFHYAATNKRHTERLLTDTFPLTFPSQILIFSTMCVLPVATLRVFVASRLVAQNPISRGKKIAPLLQKETNYLFPVPSLGVLHNNKPLLMQQNKLKLPIRSPGWQFLCLSWASDLH